MHLKGAGFLLQGHWFPLQASIALTHHSQCGSSRIDKLLAPFGMHLHVVDLDVVTEHNLPNHDAVKVIR